MNIRHTPNSYKNADETCFVTGNLSDSLQENITRCRELLPLDNSFDFMTRDLYLGETPAFLMGINGFCKTDILQQIFSDLQYPLYTKDGTIEDLIAFAQAKIGYVQITPCASWEVLIRNLLSGPAVLMVEGFDQALLIDARTYPARGISEPDAERVSRGARDGFVETMLFNANLLRRRVRSPRLTFSIHTLGATGQTDVAVAYLDDCVNRELLEAVEQKLESLNITALTMGSKSLEELLLPKKWFHPLPSIQLTERPDVAASYLIEGHILILVDNSPTVLILPCTIFQFTQSPEDYYKPPLIGTYFRFMRGLCIPVTLLLMPLFLLLTVYYPETASKLQLLTTGETSPVRITFYVLAVEFLLDLLRYSAALTSGRFSSALSLVGGLLIGDIAVELNWASTEVLFYAAVTLLTSLALSSPEFADALRVYRIFIEIGTAAGGTLGFGIAIVLVLLSAVTTPTFGGMSYFWPLFPFNGRALRHLLFRSPTTDAQPVEIWNRGHLHHRK